MSKAKAHFRAPNECKDFKKSDPVAAGAEVVDQPDLRADALSETVRRLVETAPTLSEPQRSSLAALLGGAK